MPSETDCPTKKLSSLASVSDSPYPAKKIKVDKGEKDDGHKRWKKWKQCSMLSEAPAQDQRSLVSGSGHQIL